MYKSVLQNRSFRAYLLGGGISRLGDVMSGIAFPFLTFNLTHCSFHTTTMVIAETLPYLLFGLIGGVIADWVKKKPLLIVIDLLRAPLIGSIYFMDQAGYLSFGYLLCIGFLIQSFGCFFNPAHRALLPFIITQEKRTAANSLLDTVTRGVEVLSPGVTLFLLNQAGLISFFLFDAFSYVASACMIALIRVPDRPVVNTERKRVTDVFLAINQFVIWVQRETTLRKLFIITFITVFFNTWVWEVGLLLELKRNWVNAEAWFSSLKGAFGAAVIMTNLLVPFVWQKLTFRTYLLGGIIWGVGVIILGWANQLPLYFVSMLIAGIGMPLAGLSRVFLLQQLLPADKLGRGFSFNAMLLYLANVLSLSLFGFFSIFISFTVMFVVCGTMMAAAAAFYLYRLRKELGETAYTRLNS